jgi:hypothetical protein
VHADDVHAVSALSLSLPPPILLLLLAVRFELNPGFQHPYQTPVTQTLLLAAYPRAMLEACPEENYYPLVIKLESVDSPCKEESVVSAQFVYCDFVCSGEEEKHFEIRHLMTRVQYQGKLYNMQDIYGCALPTEDDEIGRLSGVCGCWWVVVFVFVFFSFASVRLYVCV